MLLILVLVDFKSDTQLNSSKDKRGYTCSYVNVSEGLTVCVVSYCTFLQLCFLHCVILVKVYDHDVQNRENLKSHVYDHVGDHCEVQQSLSKNHVHTWRCFHMYKKFKCLVISTYT